ncbi:MAG: hypothetical protein ACI4XI_06905 [Ruminococcus sp.]
MKLKIIFISIAAFLGALIFAFIRKSSDTTAHSCRNSKKTRKNHATDDEGEEPNPESDTTEIITAAKAESAEQISLRHKFAEDEIRKTAEKIFNDDQPQDTSEKDTLDEIDELLAELDNM